jgi:hypothetical protein
MRALIFDLDGTLIDSVYHCHLSQLDSQEITDVTRVTTAVSTIKAALIKPPTYGSNGVATGLKITANMDAIASGIRISAPR